jgi:hypothetical protein
MVEPKTPSRSLRLEPHLRLLAEDRLICVLHQHDLYRMWRSAFADHAPKAAGP